MILPDVNILIYAHREDATDHAAFREWLHATANGDQAFGLSELVLSGFLRIITHPRVFNPPTPMPLGLDFVTALKSRPNAVMLAPGPRHWEIFERLCRAPGLQTCRVVWPRRRDHRADE